MVAKHLTVAVAALVIGFLVGLMIWKLPPSEKRSGAVAANEQDQSYNEVDRRQSPTSTPSRGAQTSQTDTESHPTRRIPLDLLAYDYYAFDDFDLDPDAARILGLDAEQVQRVGEIYRSAIAEFSEARRENLKVIESEEPGVYLGEISPFPDRVAEIHHDLNAAFIEAIGLGKAKHLSVLTKRVLMQETHEFGRDVETVRIERRDGESKYKRYFFDAETGDLKSGGDVSGWMMDEDDEARTESRDESQYSMTLRATFEALGVWPAREEDR